MESIKRLVIPRVRAHHEGQNVESTQTDHLERTVRQHNVTWHIRELPNGWRASPAALELAQKLGITLKENETIVREHKRGSRLLGEVAAHHLITRP